DWNDDRVRTVFAAPDVHLVFKLHNPSNLLSIGDELYEGDQLPRVNAFYRQLADHLVTLNETFNYTLWKTVTLLEVTRTPDSYTVSPLLFSSPLNPDVF